MVARLIPLFRTAGWGPIAATTAIAAGLAVFYLILHWAVSRYTPRLNRWVGAVLAVLPLIAVYFWGGPRGDEGALTYLGVSLLLAGARGDGGCEVMSIPGVLSGSRTHLVCLVFSPVDWLEESIASRI